MKLQILQVTSRIDPSKDEFEVYQDADDVLVKRPLYTSPSLHAAVDFCFTTGHNFEVRTKAAYRRAEL